MEWPAHLPLEGSGGVSLGPALGATREAVGGAA